MSSKLLICEYFDSLTNKIDIEVETILNSLSTNGNTDDLDQSKIDEINLIRNKYIAEIQRVEKLNLDYYDRNLNKIEDTIKSIRQLENNTDNIYNHLLEYFCFFFEDPFSHDYLFSFGNLVIIDTLITDASFEDLKYDFYFLIFRFLLNEGTYEPRIS